MKEVGEEMRGELRENGLRSVERSDDVNEYMENIDNDERRFVVMKSRWGCGGGLGGGAGVGVGEENEVKGDDKVRVFGGEEKEGRERMRD
ncbi:BrxA/BrxB family bacilliredoxin [Staphylococcus epidermidis]|uniref:BrxA/BrxB family bacilliredoxin n=1 Tax=Staphylococcus epidermidis TaxID=1282 RepID=UPI0011A85D23|nr:BrxA/BrxB family bacilliredoxin [Staphylococcus epidermidis]